MPQLHETGYGQKLFGSEIPRAIKALERIAAALEKMNKNQDIIKINEDAINTLNELGFYQMEDDEE